MDKKLLKYSDFINESLIDKIGPAIKKALTPKRIRIKKLVQEMIAVEKEFIKKTDELNFNIYQSQNAFNRRGLKAPGVDPLLRQRGLVNKRALDAFERSKNSKIASIQDQILRLIGKDKSLGSYYNSEAAKADKIIADFAYTIAIRHKNGAYADSYTSQFSDMENLRRSLGNVIPSSGGITDQDGELEEISEIGNYKVDKPYCLKWQFFIQFLEGRTEQELVKWKHDGFAIRLRYSEEHKALITDLNERKKFLTDEKKRYAANSPVYDVEIDEIERNKKIAENRFEEFKNYMRMKVDYITRLIRPTSNKRN